MLEVCGCICQYRLYTSLDFGCHSSLTKWWALIHDMGSMGREGGREEEEREGTFIYNPRILSLILFATGLIMQHQTALVVIRRDPSLSTII